MRRERRDAQNACAGRRESKRGGYLREKNRYLYKKYHQTGEIFNVTTFISRSLSSWKKRYKAKEGTRRKFSLRGNAKLTAKRRLIVGAPVKQAKTRRKNEIEIDGKWSRENLEETFFFFTRDK